MPIATRFGFVLRCLALMLTSVILIMRFVTVRFVTMMMQMLVQVLEIIELLTSHQ